MNDADALLNRLCHLMVALEHAIGELPDGAGGTTGLDMPGLAVLVSLDLFGEMRSTSVAQLLGGTTSMATKVLGRLERDGRVERHHGAVPDDRRAVTVRLTDAGRRAIAACEVALVDLHDDVRALVASVDAGDARPAGAGDPGELPGDVPPSTGPALAELLRFVVAVDEPLLATVGDLDALHPRDPRGLLVLSELDRRGPLGLGDVPAMIDRSRSSTHRLCADLEAIGVVTRRDDTSDQRRVVLELTPVGRAVVRGTAAAIAAHVPRLQPSAHALARALAGERQGLGSPTS